MTDDRIAALERELAATNASFDDLVRSSKDVETELERELAQREAQLRALSTASQALKDKHDDAQAKLAAQAAALESERAAVRDLKASSERQQRAAHDEIVRLENEASQLEAKCRAAEAANERWQSRYEALLEQQTLVQCEVEELRLRARESEQRAKLVAEEAPMPHPDAGGSAALRAELELYKTMLADVLRALSKGAVALPHSAQHMVGAAQQRAAASEGGARAVSEASTASSHNTEEAK